jgi:hypothetical protein
MAAREGGHGTHTGRDHPEPGSAVVWGGGRRDDARVARRLSRQPVVGGVSQLVEGAWRDDFLHGLQALGVMVWWEHACGTASPRERRPCSPDGWRDGLQTRWGSERIQALPRVRCREEVRMPWVGCTAPPVRAGVGQRGAPTRQAVRGLVVCTRLMVALATASRRPCARADRGGDAVGWQRWRRQPTRARVIVWAQGDEGRFHLAASARW